MLVTGAASGMGHCLALEFARQGCDLVLVDINPDGLERTAGEVRGLGSAAECHTVDITDSEQVGALASGVSPGVLVNCAGLGFTADLEHTTMADWHLLFDVNMFGTINMVQAFLPGMKAAGTGRIMNIASGFGLVSFPSMGAYCASKHAVVAYTEALAAEVKRYGIRVTLVCPGITRTPFLDATDMKGYDDTSRRREFLQRVLPLVSTTPDSLARFAVKALRRDRRMVVHTWVAKLAYYSNRVSRLVTGAFLDLVYRVVTRMRPAQPGP